MFSVAKQRGWSQEGKVSSSRRVPFYRNDLAHPQWGALQGAVVKGRYGHKKHAWHPSNYTSPRQRLYEAQKGKGGEGEAWGEGNAPVAGFRFLQPPHRPIFSTRLGYRRKEGAFSFSYTGLPPPAHAARGLHAGLSVGLAAGAMSGCECMSVYVFAHMSPTSNWIAGWRTTLWRRPGKATLPPSGPVSGDGGGPALGTGSTRAGQQCGQAVAQGMGRGAHGVMKWAVWPRDSWGRGGTRAHVSIPPCGFSRHISGPMRTHTKQSSGRAAKNVRGGSSSASA